MSMSAREFAAWKQIANRSDGDPIVSLAPGTLQKLADAGVRLTPAGVREHQDGHGTVTGEYLRSDLAAALEAVEVDT